MQDMTSPAESLVDTSAAGDPELARVLIPLLKGIVYREDAAQWAALLTLQGRVRDFIGVLGLTLMLDETEGYAFLRMQADTQESDDSKLPRLVARRPLSFPVSLLLALLRKKLAEFDASGSDTRLILARSDVVDLMRVFLPAGSNETRLVDQIDTHINKVAELGFVRKLRGQDGMIEVQRILKAFVDAQWLAQFDRNLAAYRASLQTQAAILPTGPNDE
nr:DUF4194 domain-containing protein [Pollutimonas subterranea]